MKAFKRSKSKEKEEYPSFTNFTVKVPSKSTWYDTVNTVLKGVEGVNTFKKEGDEVNISGFIYSNKLLKNLKSVGKKVEVVRWQYGECSNNLFQVTEPPAAEVGNGAPANYLDPSYNVYMYENWNRFWHENMYPNSYPRIERNHAYNHLECAGNAEDCNGHHMERANNSVKSSSSIPKRISASEEWDEPIIPSENYPKCYCSLM